MQGLRSLDLHAIMSKTIGVLLLQLLEEEQFVFDT
jgi:hypothetical protein